MKPKMMEKKQRQQHKHIKNLIKFKYQKIK